MSIDVFVQHCDICLKVCVYIYNLLTYVLILLIKFFLTKLYSIRHNLQTSKAEWLIHSFIYETRIFTVELSAYWRVISFWDSRRPNLAEQFSLWFCVWVKTVHKRRSTPLCARLIEPHNSNTLVGY